LKDGHERTFLNGRAQKAENRSFSAKKLAKRIVPDRPAAPQYESRALGQRKLQFFGPAFSNFLKDRDLWSATPEMIHWGQLPIWRQMPNQVGQLGLSLSVIAPARCQEFYLGNLRFNLRGLSVLLGHEFRVMILEALAIVEDFLASLFKSLGPVDRAFRAPGIFVGQLARSLWFVLA
jgi:hypothetical protein